MNEINVKIEKKGNKLKSIVFGLVVIAAGVLLIYRNMGLLDPEMKRIFFSWQMIMIAAGFINVFGKSSRLFGLILMSVGGFFMLPRIMELPVNFTQTFWPLLVIVAGVLIVFFSMKGCKKFGKVSQSSTDDVIDDMFVFSGGERLITTEDFKGGKSVNVFGGSTYDMTRSNLAEGTHILEVFCVFGGTKIIVPSNWNVRIEVSSVLGAFEDKRKFLSETVNPKGTLIIKGVAVLGGGEIASHK
jgi:predicted membrane protein